MEGEDAKEITEAKDKLLEKANALSAKVYEEAAKNNQANASDGATGTDDSNKDKDDNVVDADYEEK